MNVVLGNEGINDLKKWLLYIKGQLPSIVREAENRLGERGKYYLLGFAPSGIVDGNYGGSVVVEDTGQLVRVGYVGQDVAYIEFGTGYIGQINPYPDVLVLNNAMWEYDINQHGEEGWYYKKKDGSGIGFSIGMKPFAPVLNSYLSTEKDVVGVLQEVLNEKLS